MGNIGTWQLVIVLAIVLVLFGAKRLPEAARGLGRSLKIFKTETQGLVNGDEKSADSPEGQETPEQAEQTRSVEPTAQAPSQPAEPATDESKREA